MTLLQFTEREARRFIAERHRELYDRLLLATSQYPVAEWPRVPELVIVDDAYLACGQYSQSLNRCKYSLPYCCHLGEEYWRTIAHELAHAFAGFISGDVGGRPVHGSLFQHVSGLAGIDVSTPEAVRENTYHTYDVRAVEQAADELRRLRGSVGNDIKAYRRESLKDKAARLNVVNREAR